jgi:hypothetical protein
MGCHRHSPLSFSLPPAEEHRQHQQSKVLTVFCEKDVGLLSPFLKVHFCRQKHSSKSKNQAFLAY